MTLFRSATIVMIPVASALMFASGRSLASAAASTDTGSALWWIVSALMVVSVVVTILVVFQSSFCAFLIRIYRFLRGAAKSGAGRYTAFVMLTLALSGALFGVFWDQLEGSNEPALSTTIRNAMLIVGGALALPLAIWRGYVAEQQVKATQESVEAAQESIANQRFQAAAQMLGHDFNAVRLSAIHTLTDLARENPVRFHIDTVRLLSAFVRQPPVGNSVVIQYQSLPKDRAVREDVSTALFAIGSRTSQAADAEVIHNHRVNLEGYDFAHMNLASWNLSRVMLQGANFYGANLEGTDFTDADLSKCTFSSADVSEATFSNAKLSGANFTRWRLDDGQYTEQLTDPEAREVEGLTQEQLDSAENDQNDPPKLRGVRGKWAMRSLSWHGRLQDQL